MKQSVRITRDMILGMAKVAIEEARHEPISKEKFLIVDGELYGKVEFPRSMALCCGMKMSFPGYGEVQVLEATIDTLRCTREIDEGLYREYQTGPKTPDPTPPIIPPRVAVAPSGLLPEGSDGSAVSINRELGKAGVRSSCSLPSGTATLNRVPGGSVPCPCPEDKPGDTEGGGKNRRGRVNRKGSTPARFL